MAVKAWFDYETYMSNKLNQMVKAEPQAGWTAESLKAAFEKAGFVGDTGAQEHFLKWGHKEDVSPNKMFDADYYYQAKALAYYTSTEAGSAQVAKEVVLADLAGYGDKMEAIIKGAGMDAWTHYTKYGTKEGINPSNDFDTSNYMAAKIAAMNGTMTADEVYAAFKKAGMNALAHAEMYAGKGGQETAAAAETFVVPEDEQLPTTDTGTALTVNIDNLSGTHFTADPFVNSLGDVKQTLNTGDTLKGTGEDNSLDVTWSGGTDNGHDANANVLVTPTMTNVQTLNITNVGLQNLEINGKNIQGLTTVNNSDSIMGFEINKLSTKIENVSIKSTDRDTTVNMESSALAGSEDNLNVTVDGLTNGSDLTTSRGYETVTLTAANNASSVDRILTPDAKTVTVGGDQNLVIRGVNDQDTSATGDDTGSAPLSATVTSVDASAMTGNFTLGSIGVGGLSGAFTSSGTAVSVKAGAGNDKLYIGDMGDKYTVDGGDGSDTLYITGATGTAARPASFTKAPSIEGVETLGVLAGDGNGVDGSVNLELKGVEGVSGLITGARTVDGAQNAIITLKNMTHNAEQDFTITAHGTEADQTQYFNGIDYRPYGTVTDKAHVTMNIDNGGHAAGFVMGALNFGKVENVDMNVSDLASDQGFDLTLGGALETFNFSAEGGNAFNLGTIGKSASLKAASISTDAALTMTVSQAGDSLMSLHGKGTATITFTGDNAGMTVDSDDRDGAVTLLSTVANNASLVGGSGSQTLGDGATNTAATYQGGTGADIINADGTGTNTFVYSVGDSTSTAYDTINGAATNDMVKYADGAVTAGATAAAAAAGVAKLTAGIATFNAADSTLAKQLAAIDAALTAEDVDGAGVFAAFVNGADSYVFISDGTAGISDSDVVVKLAGVAVTAAAVHAAPDTDTIDLTI